MVEDLDLAGDLQTPQDIDKFISEIGRHPNVKKLNLRYADLSNEETAERVIQELLKLKNLEDLNLESCKLGLNPDFASISKAFGSHPTLKVLNLAKNELHTRMDHIARIIYLNPWLTELNLRGNNIDASSLRSYARKLCMRHQAAILSTWVD